jgi:hypothetical protein
MYNRTHEKQTVPSRNPVVHETSQTTNQKITESNATITTLDLRSCRACRSSWGGDLETMLATV